VADTFAYFLAEGQPVTLENLTVNNPPCGTQNGSIEVEATAGAGEALEYSLDGETYQASNLLSGLGAGVYTVYVRSASGCVASAEVPLTEEATFVVNYIYTSPSCADNNNGAIEVMNVTGGQPPYEYSIDGENFSANNKFENLAAGLHTIYIRDASDCPYLEAVTLEGPAELAITTEKLNPTCRNPQHHRRRDNRNRHRRHSPLSVLYGRRNLRRQQCADGLRPRPGRRVRARLQQLRVRVLRDAGRG